MTDKYLNVNKSSMNQFNAMDKQPVPFFVDKANYIAIRVLEKIGLTEPNQKQIDVIETLISLATNKEHFTPEKFEFCTGHDCIARRIFLRHIKGNTAI